MTPPVWVRDAVFYEVFPDRFASSARVVKPGPLEPWDSPPTMFGFKGGDLLGVVEHLDDLQDLGITALYLAPIFQSAANHRYHTYDYFTVDPLLGGDAALRELLDEAHRRGMRVILDGVFNHTGRGFWAFHHVLENGAASPYRSWFHFDDWRLHGDGRPNAYPPPGTPPSELGYEAWWGIPALPKLNTSDPAVREYLLTVGEHWIRFGIDGWRLDVPEEIADESFWQEFRRRCLAIDPEAYFVGEIWHVAPDWVRGDRFDAVMDYPMGEAILGFAAGSLLDVGVIAGHNEYRANVRHLDGAAFADALEDVVEAYEPDALVAQLNFVGSHDTPRLRTVVGDDIAGVRLAFLLLMTLPGAPCLYYGDEIGMAGGLDPECRGAFPWDEGRWDRDLRAFVRAAIRLRGEEAALRSADVIVVGAAADAVAYTRGAGEDRLLVAVNAGDEPVRLEARIDDVAEGTPVRAFWASHPSVVAVGAGAAVTAGAVSVGGASVGGGVTTGPVVSGGVVELELGPRCGSVFRLG